MAYTAIDDPELYFQTKLFTGTGSALSVTLDGDENMQPDLVWIKERSESDSAHNLTDSVRGAGKGLFSNTSAAEYDYGTGSDGSVLTFASDGFTLGTATQVNPSSVTMVSWNWKAGTTSGISGSPSITPSGYSFNQTSGFSIITYEGDGNDGDTIPHGLGVKPDVVFFKKTDGATNWVVQSNLLGNRVQLVLNDTDAENTDARLGASDDWDTTTVELGTYGDLNNDGDDFVAYCWSSIQGYSKIGLYTGNGDADGTFVYTGFRPAYVMVKNIDEAENWIIFDNKRPGYNLTDALLKPNLVNAESTSGVKFDLLSNGFKARVSDAEGNSDGGSFVYIAFAESPFVNSSGVPNNAR